MNLNGVNRISQKKIKAVALYRMPSRREERAELLKTEEGTRETIVSCSPLVLHIESKYAELQVRRKETVGSFCRSRMYTKVAFVVEMFCCASTVFNVSITPYFI
jgi:hypothetical protein